MKALLFLVLLFQTANAGIRCRVITTNGLKIRTSKWKRGESGCETVMSDAKFSYRLFGDKLKYSIEVRDLGHSTVVMLNESKRELRPFQETIPDDRDEKGKTPMN